jgi:hypothetical protein
VGNPPSERLEAFKRRKEGMGDSSRQRPGVNPNPNRFDGGEQSRSEGGGNPQGERPQA